MTTINWKNVSRADMTSSLRFSDPKTTANGMKILDLASNGKQAILQTPQLMAPFGANDKFEPGKFKLLLRLVPLGLVFCDLASPNFNLVGLSVGVGEGYEQFC